MNSSPVHKLSTGPSLADQAYAALREGITSGRFTPGQTLTERALAGDLGVSPTPVREAISRLEHERLLERDGRALTVVRIEAALRGVAARIAAERATADEVAEIAAIHAQAQRVKQRGRAVEDVARDVLASTRLFHAKIDQASHNPLLVDMIATATAFDWTVRLRAASTLGPQYPAKEGHGEHEEILDALRARDGDRAERLMAAHTLRTGQQFLAMADLVSTEAVNTVTAKTETVNTKTRRGRTARTP
jgi:DNA-binding GntR family transcriptional regulator